MYQGVAGIKDTDLGLAVVVAEIEKLGESYVKIGFQVGDVTKSQSKNGRSKKAGLNMAQIAASNEFGTDIIPARPFMRTAFDENREAINRSIERQYEKVLTGESTVKKSLDLLGLFMQSLIQKKIRAIRTPPNAPRTIALKKSSKPLIDFGQMIQSVRYVTVIK